ncbi:MAG: AAC(3) family N-acetyltransferase [Lentisphaeria bacterium]|nr:AAC(3) family N-acetyltransferase [Lentisphaeria bacterium]
MNAGICYDLNRKEIREANAREPITTTKEQFAEALRTLGVTPGIRLVVHTALASLGHFEGGPEAYCKTLMECVTEKGTLMLPGLTRYPGPDDTSFCYVPSESPSGVGVAPDVFRKLPGVVRSWDPTHSFCVWGAEKESFVRDHHKLPTMDKDSPLGLMEQAGGWCLTVGCHDAVTFMHVVETACHAPCLGARSEVYDAVLPGAGKVKLRGWGWRKGPCRALRHKEIWEFMRSQGALREMMLGRSHLLLFKLADYRTAYARLLTAPENGCAGCPVRPRQVPRTVESDWDEKTRTLKESEAFKGEWRDS